MKTLLVIAAVLACVAAMPSGSSDMPDSWVQGMEAMIQECEDLGYTYQKDGMESVPQSVLDGCEKLQTMAQGNFQEDKIFFRPVILCAIITNITGTTPSWCTGK